MTRLGGVWMEAVVAFVGAGIWLGAYLWLRRTLSESDPLYAWALLALMGSAVLGPILWVTLRRRLSAAGGPAD